MSQLDDIMDELDRIGDMVEAFRASLRDGEDVDLVRFNRRISEVCGAAMALSGEAHGEVRPKLMALLDQLNGVRADLETLKEQRTGREQCAGE